MVAPSRPLDHALLEGPRAGDALAIAMASVGGEVRSWRIDQIAVQPRRGATAAYRVEVAWPDRPTTVEHLSVAVGRIPDGVLVLDDGQHRLGVWRHPFDPALPGLPAASDPHRMAELLAGFGLTGPVQLSTLAYRPGRRAVIEARGADGRLFVKVVRPHLVEALHHRHREVVAAGVPAPESLGWTDDGLVVLAPLPGSPRSQVIDRGGSVPGPDALLELLDRLPHPLRHPARRRSWLERAPHYAAVIGAAVPELTGRADAICALLAHAGEGELVTVHGDLYDSQLLVADGRYIGLLDLDTAAPGDRLDDLACFLGHLAVASLDDPARATTHERTLTDHLAAFDRVVPPRDLRHRVAAVVVALATGPHRVQGPDWPSATEARLALAEQWVAAAGERTLTCASPAPQARTAS